MTYVLRLQHGILLAGLLLSSGAVFAQQNTAAATNRSVQAQQVQQQQVRNQQAQENLREQLRQNNADAVKRPSAENPTLSRQLDQADQAARQREQARQRDLRDSYQRAQVPPAPKPAPRPSASGGH